MKSHLVVAGLVAIQLAACGGEQDSPGTQSEPPEPEGNGGTRGAADAGGSSTGGAIGDAPAGGAADFPEQPMAGAGGDEPLSGGAGGDPNVDAGPAMLGPDGYPDECVQDPVLPETAAGRTTIEVSLWMGDEPFVFGEENALPGGGSVLPTNFRFYLSQFELSQGETRVAAMPVSAAGSPLPFAVQLVNAENASSLSFQLAAPPGEYDGISYLVGLAEGCNGTFGPLAPPLDEGSQMKWPHALGFLFLRFEGTLSSDVAETTPGMIHMGRAAGDEGFAPRFQLQRPISVAEAATPLALHVDFAEVMEAASMETDLSDFEAPPPAPPTLGEEVYAGERLRRNADLVQIFTSP